MIQILMPIACGSNECEGIEYQRSLFEIEQRIIIQHVIESLSSIKDSNLTFVIKREDIRSYHMDNIVKLIVPNAKVIISEGSTQGSACTCLLAIDELDMDEPLVICGSNQIINRNLQEIIDYFNDNNCDAGTVIFDDVHPRWSYVAIDEDGFVTEAAEKNPISRNATTGFFYYKKASTFIDSAMSMILKGATVDNKYYVCPSLNELVLQNKTIGTFRIDRSEYFNLGYESGIAAFKKHLGDVSESI